MNSHTEQARARIDAVVDELRTLREDLADAPRILERKRQAAVAAREELEEYEAHLARCNQRMRDLETRLPDMMMELAGGKASGRPAAKELSFQQPSRATRADYDMDRPEEKAITFSPATERTGEPQKPVARELPELAAFLVDRDVFCPSCMANLRGQRHDRCHSCGLELSLKSIIALRPVHATRSTLAVRFLSGAALLLCLVVWQALRAGLSLPGCEKGSSCFAVLLNPWFHLGGVSLLLGGAVVYAGMFVASFIVPQGQRDGYRLAAWYVLSGLAVISLGVGAWLTAAQFFVLGAVCTYCLLINLIGMSAGILVLLRLPIARDAAVPAPTATPLRLQTRQGIMSLFAGAAVVAGLIGTLLVADRPSAARQHLVTSLGGLLEPSIATPKEPAVDPDPYLNVNPSGGLKLKDSKTGRE